MSCCRELNINELSIYEYTARMNWGQLSRVVEDCEQVKREAAESNGKDSLPGILDGRQANSHQ